MLELYQAEGCPHSSAVREKLTELGLSYVVHNPRQPGDEGGEVVNVYTHQELLDTGGEDAIPYLVDTDREQSLYESEDIIEYLDSQYG